MFGTSCFLITKVDLLSFLFWCIATLQLLMGLQDRLGLKKQGIIEKVKEQQLLSLSTLLVQNASWQNDQKVYTSEVKLADE